MVEYVVELVCFGPPVDQEMTVSQTPFMRPTGNEGYIVRQIPAS